MSTYNLQFYKKRRKFLKYFFFSSYRKNFVGTKKRVRISHGKRAIGVRAIEVQLYLEGGPVMWKLPLYLHVNQKSIDDDDE